MKTFLKKQISSDTKGNKFYDHNKHLKTTSSKFGTIYLYTEGKVPRKWLLDTDISLNMAKIEQQYEPMIIEWFANSNVWEKDWKLHIINPICPEWNEKIESSFSGLITNKENKPIAIIQIKTPKRIYKSLTRARQFETIDCDHIPFTHYCQIQSNMAIVDVDLCYYIVMGYEKDLNVNKSAPTRIYIEKVKRNNKFWHNKLYPSISLYLS